MRTCLSLCVLALVCVWPEALSAAGVDAETALLGAPVRKIAETFQASMLKELVTVAKGWDDERKLRGKSWAERGAPSGPRLWRTIKSGERELWYLSGVVTKGKLDARLGEYVPGNGLVLAPSRPMSFRDFDDDALEVFYPLEVRSKVSIYPWRTLIPEDATAKNAAELRAQGKLVLLQYAAFLYENDAPWAGNHVLTFLLRSFASDAGFCDQIRAFLRQRHKWREDAELKELALGEGAAQAWWLLPEAEFDDRRKAFEQRSASEIPRLLLRAARLDRDTKAQTWDEMLVERDAKDPLLNARLGLTFAGMREEIADALARAEGSAAATQDRTAWQAANALKTPDKQRAASLKTLHGWYEEYKMRAEAAAQATEAAQQAFARAEDQVEAAHGSSPEFFADAEAKYRLLLSVRLRDNNKREVLSRLDPNVGYSFWQYGFALSETCGPTQYWDQCADEAKAREAVEALTIASRWFADDPVVVNRLAAVLLALKEWDKAREALERAEALEQHPTNGALKPDTRKLAKQRNERLRLLYTKAYDKHIKELERLAKQREEEEKERQKKSGKK